MGTSEYKLLLFSSVRYGFSYPMFLLKEISQVVTTESIMWPLWIEISLHLNICTCSSIFNGYNSSFGDLKMIILIKNGFLFKSLLEIDLLNLQCTNLTPIWVSLTVLCHVTPKKIESGSCETLKGEYTTVLLISKKEVGVPNTVPNVPHRLSLNCKLSPLVT